ncbi:MAG: alpha-amylase [Planctomycetaceae bacterium]|nr:alpha-amylase [Planctomycetaceae bacterium]
MPSVCMYFQMHQPLRLGRYSVFDTRSDYFDDHHNVEILQKVVDKCYAPATRLLLDLIDRHDGRFRLSLSVSGVLIDQLRTQAAHVIDALEALARTGCVEFLNETYYHSMSFLYSRDEFRAQVEQHAAMIEDLFGQSPVVFRNTELIYNNDLAHYIGSLGRHRGILAEGADHVLHGRSVNEVYRPPHTEGISLLLKNYGLSDDIAFRFSNHEWPEFPLTAEKYAGWINRLNGQGRVCNLFMDFETFGEHQWAETGIFDFLDELPGQLLASPDNDFLTVSEAIDRYEPVDTFDTPHMISWADTERDLSAWLGNAMQSNALHELYKLEQQVKESGDAALLADWRRLTTSDHVYYMCTKYYANGAVHNYFNPYESPYDSYINFMNVMDNLRTRVALHSPDDANPLPRRLAAPSA